MKPVIRLKLVENNLGWESLNKKIEDIQEWFSSHIDLIIDVEHTEYVTIPFEDYKSSADQINESSKRGVDKKWYDTFLSPMGKGYHIVLFAVPLSQWGSTNFRGWRTDNNTGPVELQVSSVEGERYTHNGKDRGGAFVNFARHEILHALFMIYGQHDMTHYWWDRGQLELALDAIDFPEPKVAERVGLMMNLLRLAQQLLGLLIKEKNRKEITMIIPIEEPHIEVMCDAIQRFEGWFTPGENAKYPHGSISWRNMNPGNLRPAGQKGMIGEKGGFAVFSTYADGKEALRNQIKLAISGRSRVYRPDMTLLEFFQTYAPSSDNNYPEQYAKYVAGIMGVTYSFLIKNIKI